MAQRPVLRFLLVGLIGAIAALGQAPLGLWPVTLVALSVLFGMFRHTADWRQALWLGWAAGTGYFMLALSWIVEPFMVDIARHGWMAPFALVFLGVGLAVFWAMAFAVARKLGGGALTWCAAFVLSEALRGWIFTGFPWAQIGHIWIDTPMLHWASVGGSLGLSAVAVLAGVSLWHLVDNRRFAGSAGALAIAGFFVAGSVLAPDAAAREDAPVVRLIQPNAPQREKWDPDKVQIFFDRQIEFTRAGGNPDLIVWPETAVPVLLENADTTLRGIARMADGAPVVLGIQRFGGQRLFNSLVLLDSEGEVEALYDKHHLVPFGEYVPFGDVLSRFGLKGMAAQEGDGYSSGPGPQVIDVAGLGTALPLICYEGVFPTNIISAPERADFMLLITNDAWFGEMSGPYQHLAQARLRSAEQGLPMIRVANTGVSAVIDGAGRVTAQIPLGQAGWIDEPLPPALPETLYARTGDWPVLGMMVALMGLSLLGNARRQ